MSETSETERARRRLEEELVGKYLNQNKYQIVCTDDQDEFERLKKSGKMVTVVESKSAVPLFGTRKFAGCAIIRRKHA